MLTLEKRGDCFTVYRQELPLGTVEAYCNPYHAKNCYLKLNLASYPHEISEELFSKIMQEVGKPLQVMLCSDETEQIAFLHAGDFACARKCYEVQAVRADLIVQPSDCSLISCKRGDKVYAQCCALLYDAYLQNHEFVNPWTAGFEAFCKMLPEDAFYDAQDEKLFAFVEENEIASFCAEEPTRVKRFGSALAEWLFETCETICFECDDGDWAAMSLRAIFANQSDESYNTYIRRW